MNVELSSKGNLLNPLFLHPRWFFRGSSDRLPGTDLS